MLSFKTSANQYRTGYHKPHVYVTQTMKPLFGWALTQLTLIIPMIPDEELEFLLQEYMEKRDYWGVIISSTLTTESYSYLSTPTFTISWPTPIVNQAPNKTNAWSLFSKNYSSLFIIFVYIIFI